MASLTRRNEEKYKECVVKYGATNFKAKMEAEAMEIPVVATTVGGIPEAVDDGVTGMLVPPNDTVALADAVCSLLDDQGRRRSMGKAGRQFVRERYDWLENAGRMERLYRSLIETQS